MRVNVGDKVQIFKPEDTHERPGWNPKMDRYDGMIVTVSNVRGTIFNIEEDNRIQEDDFADPSSRWWFSESWAYEADTIDIDKSNEGEIDDMIGTFA